MIELFSSSDWQMTFGERAALEGILGQLKPDLSIEIGTAQGGSLKRIAAHSSRVHSFDLMEPEPAIKEIPNVMLHTGDSHVLLAEFLSQLEGSNANVDFALVDGDHTAEGVRQDLDALLSSAAVARCVILIHDTSNEVVREGLELVRYGDYPKIAYLDLDFLAGHLSKRGAFHHQLWGGIGLAVVDDRVDTPYRRCLQDSDFYSGFDVLAAIREGLADAYPTGRDLSPQDVVRSDNQSLRQVELAEDLNRAHITLSSMKNSFSWRVTAPLRKAKQAVIARRGS